MSANSADNSAKANSKIHVVTVTPFFPSQKNPVNGCFVAEPAGLFPHFGIDSTVIAVSPLYQSANHPIASAPAEWVRYPAFPGLSGLPSSGRFLYARLASKLRRLHEEKPIDVIHAHTAMPSGDAARLLGQQLGVPFVVTVHGLDVLNTCGESGVAAEKRRKKAIEVYASAQTVICVSDKVQENVRAATPRETRTHVVPNGVDAEMFCPVQDLEARDAHEILVAGSLLRSKGHSLVLNAVARLTAAFPAIRCRIIGEGADQLEFEALARELGMEQRVQFLGRQSRAEVAQAMQRCSVFALPSLNEGLGCVYLEAMSCAKPVIACRGQGIDGIIEHGKNGFLVPRDGLEELVQELTHLLQSTEYSQRIGTAARETILRDFTLGHQAKKLAAIFHEAKISYSQEHKR